MNKTMLDLQNITKEQAIQEHRKMWNWIADETEKTRVRHTKLNYILNNTTMHDRLYLIEHASCFCCVYGHNKHMQDCHSGSKCDHCPLEWGSDLDRYMCTSMYSPNDGKGLYTKWYDAPNIETTVKYARQIANLPKRNI